MLSFSLLLLLFLGWGFFVLFCFSKFPVSLNSPVCSLPHLVVKASAPRAVACLLACLTSRQHASVSQGRICSDNFTCCHTEIEIADQTFLLTQSLYTDTGPTSPSADPITPGAWQGSHWNVNFEVTGMTRPRKNPQRRKRDSNPGSSALEADALTTRPTRRSPESGRSRVRFPLVPWEFFRGRVIPVTSKLALQWLQCQAPGVTGSAQGLVCPVSVYCNWVM